MSDIRMVVYPFGMIFAALGVLALVAGIGEVDSRMVRHDFLQQDKETMLSRLTWQDGSFGLNHAGRTILSCSENGVRDGILEGAQMELVVQACHAAQEKLAEARTAAPGEGGAKGLTFDTNNKDVVRIMMGPNEICQLNKWEMQIQPAPGQTPGSFLNVSAACNAAKSAYWPSLQG